MRFANRAVAGRQLARALASYAGRDVVVVGLPRGGVPVAFEVARALDAPLDVIVVRKLGVPYQPELGMGAVGEAGALVINDDVIRLAHVSESERAEIEDCERAEVQKRAQRFRGDRPPVPLGGRTVIVVDDGIATGSTASVACKVARAQGATEVVIAVPVGPAGIERQLRRDADKVICLFTPDDFYAVGQFYDDFAQVSDGDVVALLRRAAQSRSPAAPVSGGVSAPPAHPLGRDEDVQVRVGRVLLAGHLTVPTGSGAVVVFAHGSGSSRHSPRNRHVATALNTAGLGSLLFDLLTPDEENDRANVFDIELLADRLLAVTAWLQDQPGATSLRVGYFGASTGAAAALWAAADPDCDVAAIVSRGGRPDLAGPRLSLVRAPTLLIVGGQDDVVIDLNRSARSRLRCESRLSIVPGATHLFEEPGTLDEVAQLACSWFTDHLTALSSRSL